MFQLGGFGGFHLSPWRRAAVDEVELLDGVHGVEEFLNLCSPQQFPVSNTLVLHRFPPQSFTWGSRGKVSTFYGAVGAWTVARIEFPICLKNKVSTRSSVFRGCIR